MEPIKTYFWIAINGSSCTASPVALRDTVVVSPIPQALVGFDTQKEQLAAQQLCLTAPIPKVRQWMKGIQKRAQRGEVRLIVNSRHEKRYGQTTWLI